MGLIEIATEKCYTISTIKDVPVRGHLPPRRGKPITAHNEQIHSDIFLYSQRPPKIERLANLEPVGRCKIPLNQLS